MSWEIDTHIADYIALAGSVTVIVMWLAPVRDVWTAPYSVFKTGTTDNVATGFGFVAGTFNCILWDLYAYNRLNTMLVPFVVNCVGFLLNISFVLCYFTYGSRKARRETRNQLLFMLFITALAVGIWIMEGNNNAVGYFAAFVNTLMFFGPLAAAGDVIRSRNSRGLSLLPLVMTLVASMVWFAYGVYIREIPAMLPNGLGILFGIIQILLFVWVKGQEKKIGAQALNSEFEPISVNQPIIGSRDVPSGSMHRERVRSISAILEGIP